ncbi:MAG: hypothetical protein WCY00_02920 [Candidatus Dojkabacteria bacterium]
MRVSNKEYLLVRIAGAFFFLLLFLSLESSRLKIMANPPACDESCQKSYQQDCKSGSCEYEANCTPHGGGTTYGECYLVGNSCVINCSKNYIWRYCPDPNGCGGGGGGGGGGDDDVCTPVTNCSVLSPKNYTLNSCPKGSTCESKSFSDKCSGKVTCYKPNCGSLSTTEPARYICNTSDCSKTNWTSQSKNFTYANNGSRACYRPNCSSLDSIYTSNKCEETKCFDSFCFTPVCTQSTKKYSFGTFSSSRTCYCNELNAYPLGDSSRITLEVDEVKNILLDTAEEAAKNPLPLICKTGDPQVKVYVPSVNIPGAKDTYYHYSGSLGSQQSLHPTYKAKIDSFSTNLVIEGSKGSVSGSYSVGNHCDDERRYSNKIVGFYSVEKNEKVNGPKNIFMTVDGVEYSLETKDSSKPTKVKSPSAKSENVQIKLKEFSPPATAHSSKYGYRFEVNNKGVVDEEKYTEWSAFGCTRAEDYCIEEYKQSVQEFIPSSLSFSEVFVQGSQGEVSGNYFTCNRCGCPGDGAENATRKDSDSVTGYYVVNKQPSVSGFVFKTDPRGKKNCTALDNHTGTISANEIEVEMYAIDEDNADEIEGAILYFVRGEEYPSLKENKKFVSNYNGGTNSDVVGIMIRKKGKTWESPNLYVTNQEGNWALIGEIQGSRNIQGSNGNDIVTISEVKTVKDSLQEDKKAKERVKFNFKLQFHYADSEDKDSAEFLNGTYKVVNMVFDEYMTFQGKDEDFERVDQTHGLEDNFDWVFDFDSPEMDSVSQILYPPYRLRLEQSTLLDRETAIKHIVVDAYRDAAFVESSIVLEEPVMAPDYPIEIMPSKKGTTVLEDDVGHIGVEHGWTFNLQQWPSIVQINIGKNDEGSIIFYVTAFDNACNYITQYSVLDLRSWIATKGGIMYSATNFGPEAKDFTSVRESPEIESDFARLYAFGNTLKTHTLDEIIDRMTTGTELLMSRQDFLNSVTHRDVVPVVRAKSIQDDNNSKNYWFNHFKFNLEKQRELQGEDLLYIDYDGSEIKDLSMCDSSKNCVIYKKGDIAVKKPQGTDVFLCDRRALIMAEGDIIIDPDIKTLEEQFVGCIFLSNKNIVITEGDYKSIPPLDPLNIEDAGVVGYDYIAGFLISENQINIAEATSDREKSVSDGLEVKGGMVAFGSAISNGSKAIFNNRSLGLKNVTNPVLVMSWDIRYGKLSEYFFGKNINLYKQEVGFKVF